MATKIEREIGPEAAKNYLLRQREGFFEKYLSGANILDIGFKGGNPNAVPIVDGAIGVGLDYPGYDGIHLPFADCSQDAVFVSHCLEHIDDFKTVLADWHRVLRIGGYLLIMVPHRDLYERKPNLPSRFNRAHKRFYTSNSLLAEIEMSLPVGGYRIRSLKEIDDEFDYSLRPEQHAMGSYEIELVLEKILIPIYANQLREDISEISSRNYFITTLIKAISFYRMGKEAEVLRLQSHMSSLPVPYFPIIKYCLHYADNFGGNCKPTEEEISAVLYPVIAQIPFDTERYLSQNPDVAAICQNKGIEFAREHYVIRGYFEGRDG